MGSDRSISSLLSTVATCSTSQHWLAHRFNVHAAVRRVRVRRMKMRVMMKMETRVKN